MFFLNRKTWGAIGVIAVALFFVPGISAPFRLVKWCFWSVVLVLVTMGYLSGASRPKRLLPGDRPTFFAAVAFVTWSSLAPLSTTSFFTVHSAGMLQLAMGFAFAWIVSLELTDADRKTRSESLLVLGIGGVLLSVFVILQAAGLALPGFMPVHTSEFRSSGPLGNPNWTAAFLLPLPPLLLGVRSTFSGGRIVPFILPMAILTAAATLLTGSKAGVIALGAGLAAYGFLNPRLQRRLLFGILAALSTGAILLVIGCVSSGILQTLSWTRGRLFLWNACLILVGRHPISGFGLGGFLPAYPQALPRLLNGDPLAYMPLHRIEFAYNDILQTAVEAGIPGAILLLAFGVLLLRRAFLNGDAPSRGVFGAVAAMAIYGCFDSPFRLPGTLALGWYLAGWVMAGATSDPVKPDDAVNGPIMGRALIVSVISILGTFQAVRFSGAEYFWSRGASLLRAKEIHRAAESLETATRFVPENARLQSEVAAVWMLDRNHERSLRTVDRALAAGFCFDDLFLRQRALRISGGGAATIAEWQRMAVDYPGLFTPHIELARYHVSRGDFASARKELHIVLAIRQFQDSDRPYKQEAERMLRDLRDR
jgi:O-antigen ligase